MKVRLSRRWALSLVVTAVFFSLAGIITVALAQGAGGVFAAASTPATDSFTYQGYLEVTGTPASGLFDFRFSVYDAAAMGTQIGSTDTVDDQPVDGGIFTVNLSCGGPQTVFTGGPRWLQIEVRPGDTDGAYSALPRQPITATPYAWGLHPHAQINGGLPPTDLSGAVLGVELEGYFPLGMAMHGKTATGSAVRGDATTGNGLYGYSELGYAVYGVSNGTSSATPRGYGGYFTANNGVGVYGYSSANPLAPNLYAPGVMGRSLNGAGIYGVSHGGGAWAVGVRADSSVDLIAAYDTDPWLQRRFRVDNNGNVYADGSYYGASYLVGGADFAEMLPATDSLGPGDVLAVDREGVLVSSSSAYQTSVLGVYSADPGIVAGVREGEAQEGKVPLAVVGVVPVNVSAENGAIVPGDLLVASTTPGHAMRAGDEPPQGSVIGKALEPLASGTGSIRMLVTLQ